MMLISQRAKARFCLESLSPVDHETAPLRPQAAERRPGQRGGRDHRIDPDPGGCADTGSNGADRQSTAPAWWIAFLVKEGADDAANHAERNASGDGADDSTVDERVAAASGRGGLSRGSGVADRLAQRAGA